MFSTKKNIFNKVSPMNVSMIAEAHGLSDSKARDMVIQINEELNDSSEIINNGGLVNLLKRTENERFVIVPFQIGNLTLQQWKKLVFKLWMKPSTRSTQK